MEELELLIVNGNLIDAYSGLDGGYALGVANGRIAGIYPQQGILPKAKAYLDVQGSYISPGWIDVHAHTADLRAKIGISADKIGICQGVTTVVDAGSCGSTTFHDFEEYSIKQSKTRVLSWLNISSAGLYENTAELADLSKICPEETKDLIRQKSCIRGIKVRMSRSVVNGTNTEGLQIAKKVAREMKVPLFVHIGNLPPRLEEVLDLLDAGDIVTHVLHGKAGGCLDEEEKMRPEIMAAARRGVYFDLGHGSESFSFLRFKIARENGFYLDSISTDLYSRNYEFPVLSLACTMEKCMALGMSLREVLAAVTLKPALMLRMPLLGRLKVGAAADLTIFQLMTQPGTYYDAEGASIQGKQKFKICEVIRNGQVMVQ